MKKFSIFVLVIAVIAVLTYLFFPLEMIVKKVVNKYGSEVTGTDVNLKGFKLDPYLLTTFFTIISKGKKR